MNFNTTNGQPYTRIDEVTILYPENGQATVMYTEREAIRLPDGTVRFLEGDPRRHTMTLPPMDERIPLVNPLTGAVIEGQTTSAQEIMIALTAILRRDQTTRG